MKFFPLAKAFIEDIEKEAKFRSGYILKVFTKVIRLHVPCFIMNSNFVCYLAHLACW